MQLLQKINEKTGKCYYQYLKHSRLAFDTCDLVGLNRSNT